MSQRVFTTSLRTRRRATFGLAGFVVLVIVVGVAVAALVERGADSEAHGSAPPVASATSPVPDVRGVRPGDLLATIAAMPPEVRARVVGELSPELRQALGNAAMFMASAQSLPAEPNDQALGTMLAHLDPNDADAIVSGLPLERRSPVVLARQSEAVAMSIIGSPVNP